jgi:LPS O-antigen subunit length determinant protein (WzzB/FepE family)
MEAYDDFVKSMEALDTALIQFEDELDLYKVQLVKAVEDSERLDRLTLKLGVNVRTLIDNFTRLV